VWSVADIDVEIITNCPPEKHRFGITMSPQPGEVTFYTIEVASRVQLDKWLQALSETKQQVNSFALLTPRVVNLLLIVGFLCED
jgi:hypothetical protein